jgi:hypothetical protein
MTPAKAGDFPKDDEVLISLPLHSLAAGQRPWHSVDLSAEHHYDV